LNGPLAKPSAGGRRPLPGYHAVGPADGIGLVQAIRHLPAEVLNHLAQGQRIGDGAVAPPLELPRQFRFDPVELFREDGAREHFPARPKEILVQ